MMRMLSQMNQDVPTQKRILELNPKHELFSRVEGIFGADANDDLLGHYAHLIYGQALIAEGSPLTEPAAFSEALTKVLVR